MKNRDECLKVSVMRDEQTDKMGNEHGYKW